MRNVALMDILAGAFAGTIVLYITIVGLKALPDRKCESQAYPADCLQEQHPEIQSREG